MNKKSSNYLDNIPVTFETQEIKFTQEQIIGLLKEEYFYLQRSYDEADGKCLNIKGWAITFATALILAASTVANKLILVLALIVNISIWVIECYWKGYQKVRVKRMREIEMYVNGKNMEKFRLLDTVGNFENNTDHLLYHYFFKYLFSPPVVFPHLIIVLMELFFLFQII